jgi:hypothetical protein
MHFTGAHFLLSSLSTLGYNSRIHTNRLDFTSNLMQRVLIEKLKVAQLMMNPVMEPERSQSG